jgi:hypothetical protein
MAGGIASSRLSAGALPSFWTVEVVDERVVEPADRGKAAVVSAAGTRLTGSAVDRARGAEARHSHEVIGMRRKDRMTWWKRNRGTENPGFSTPVERLDWSHPIGRSVRSGRNELLENGRGRGRGGNVNARSFRIDGVVTRWLLCLPACVRLCGADSRGSAGEHRRDCQQPEHPEAADCGHFAHAVSSPVSSASAPRTRHSPARPWGAWERPLVRRGGVRLCHQSLTRGPETNRLSPDFFFRSAVMRARLKWPPVVSWPVAVWDISGAVARGLVNCRVGRATAATGSRFPASFVLCPSPVPRSPSFVLVVFSSSW